MWNWNIQDQCSHRSVHIPRLNRTMWNWNLFLLLYPFLYYLVLIVPCGIEIPGTGEIPAQFRVLIVPCGIEIQKKPATSRRLQAVLIVPCGIEIWWWCHTCNEARCLNRTMWNWNKTMWNWNKTLQKKSNSPLGVLIVPCGIEIIVFVAIVFVKGRLNRTMWNWNVLQYWKARRKEES